MSAFYHLYHEATRPVGMRLIYLVALMLILAGCKEPPTVVPVCISHSIAGPEDLTQQFQSALDTVGIAGQQGGTGFLTMSCDRENWEPIALNYSVIIPVDAFDDALFAEYLTKLLPVLSGLSPGDVNPDQTEVEVDFFISDKDRIEWRSTCFRLSDIKEAHKHGLSGAEVLNELNSCSSPAPAADQP